MNNIDITNIEPKSTGYKYIHFEDTFTMLDYIQQISIIFADNKKETIRISIFPELNVIKQTIIQNNIWVADQSFSMN